MICLDSFKNTTSWWRRHLEKTWKHWLVARNEEMNPDTHQKASFFFSFPIPSTKHSHFRCLTFLSLGFSGNLRTVYHRLKRLEQRWHVTPCAFLNRAFSRKHGRESRKRTRRIWVESTVLSEICNVSRFSIHLLRKLYFCCRNKRTNLYIIKKYSFSQNELDRAVYFLPQWGNLCLDGFPIDFWASTLHRLAKKGFKFSVEECLWKPKKLLEHFQKTKDSPILLARL